jgi:GH25 family lysozyme M1 (1,4-beta-N-acetylmuramidase)
MKVWIPDVSEHQGKINWEKLAGKIPGAIIRIGYGDDIQSQDDIYAHYNMSECRRLNIPFAVYIYSYAKNASQIRSEIAHTKRMCKGYEPVSYWLDLEQRGNTAIWRIAGDLWKEAFGDKAGVYSWQWGFEKHVKSGRRWICAYGPNNGKRNDGYKPTISMDGWQFTSRAILSGIRGYVDMSEWYADFAGAQPIEIKPHRRVVTKKEVAALIMRHLCTHNAHGYTQDMQGRQGTGTETIDIYGVKYTIKSGDRDCSSAVISAYEAAGISCGGATYTGNMKKCMTSTGNFVWRSMKFIAQMGDNYLNEKSHTAMCLSAEPDVLMEFSINEKGTATGGKTGDQKQSGEYDEKYGHGESHLAMYYDYPWNGILQCVNEEIAFVIEEDGTISKPDKDDGYTAEDKKVEVVAPEKTDTDLGLEILADKYGKNEARKKALGSRYNAAQAEAERLNKLHISEYMKELKAYEKKHGALFK